MPWEMKVMIYGTPQQHREAQLCFEALDGTFVIGTAEDWEELRSQLECSVPSLLVVVKPGAAGMEGVYLARKYRPETPVFWFSDDGDFSVHSHRLECAYFSPMPVTVEKLRSAFHRCAHVGVEFP